jgi:uncharacterized RDD family membrane protein YckC
MEYFLLIAGEKQGPFTGYEIISDIRDGKLKGEEMIWRKGFEDWQNLRSIEDFADTWPPTPEMLAAADEARKIARTALDTPQPWLRFWARMLDYFFFSALIRISLFLFFRSGFAWLMQQEMQNPLPRSVILLLFAPIEAWMLTRYGSTPGKALLCVQVRRGDGALPTFQQAMTRSLLVYIKGMGFGFFILPLITMTVARLRLLRSNMASWDEHTQLRVEHGEPEPWRYAVVLLLVLLIFGVSMIMIFASPEGQKIMHEFQNLPK